MSEISKGQSLRRARIGISANRMAPIWDRRFYIGKSLQYAEDGMLSLVWDNGGLPVMVPVLGPGESEAQIAESLDGLLLSGGSDVSPALYGEEPRRPEWAGDLGRDQYEIALMAAFMELNKPVFGVCRGLQLMNVAMGGSLYQDVIDDGAVNQLHRDPVPYDKLNHPVNIQKPSWLFDLYQVERAQVNTVHHQAIRRLGSDLEVMAMSDDGLIEAIHYAGDSWAIGVQWHPEWIEPSQAENGFLSSRPLIRAFIDAAVGTC